MQRQKAEPARTNLAGIILLLAALILAGAYSLYGEKKIDTSQPVVQEKTSETTSILETIKAVITGEENKEEPKTAPESTPETSQPAPVNATNLPAKRPTKIDENRSATTQAPQAPPPGQSPASQPSSPNTITTNPTRKISETEYIAGLETDGKVKIYAHEAEGRTIITNDNASDAWYSKIIYDPFEDECFITIYADEDAIRNSQNLTYGCRMRGNVETGCSNMPIANWATRLGNIYSYEYEETCTQQGTMLKIDNAQKDLLSSGI